MRTADVDRTATAAISGRSPAKTAIFVSLGWVAAVAIYHLGVRAGEHSTPLVSPSASSVPVAASSPSPSASVSSPRGSGIRGEIERLIAAEVPGLDTEAKVDRYLVVLEGRAREKRRVTALEVEPAMAAIDNLRPVLGHPKTDRKRDSFALAMSRLSAELSQGGAPKPDTGRGAADPTTPKEEDR